MLGLPKNTELAKQLPKKALYAKFGASAADRERMDDALSKITIVHEVSPAQTTMKSGETVQSFFVLQVALKTKSYEERVFQKIAKWLDRPIVFLLEYQGDYRLAVFHKKLLQTPWSKLEELSLPLQGLDLDAVWENILVQVGGITIEEENTIDEQLEADAERAKIERQIAKLERLAWAEKQPRRKFEIAEQIRKLKKELHT